MTTASLLVYLCLGVGSLGIQQESCGGDDVCESQAGSSLLQHKVAQGTSASLSDRLQQRREHVVGSFECIDHVFTVYTYQAGWKDADLVLKSAVGEHMAEILREKQLESLDLDAAAEYLWKSHKSWYCAVSGNDECKINGESFDDIRATVRSDAQQPTQAELGQLSMDRANHSHGAVARSRCHSTRAENVRDVERGHGLPRASLDTLAGGLEVLQDRSVEGSRILRTVSAQVVEGTTARASEAASNGNSLTKALAHVLLANHFLLVALGEPTAVAKEESLTAAADILLDEGRCSEMALDGYKGMGLVKGLHMVIKPYMQLHCAVTETCTHTYTSVITGAPDVGGSLMQVIAGVGKAGMRLVAKGMVAGTMRLLGVQRFDSEVFDARASAHLAATEQAELAAHAEHFAAAASVAKDLLQHKEVKSSGHLIWIMGDLLRCRA